MGVLSSQTFTIDAFVARLASTLVVFFHFSANTQVPARIRVTLTLLFRVKGIKEEMLTKYSSHFYIRNI